MTEYTQRVPELLRERADLESRLKLIPYEGSVEIKTVDANKYLYIRQRVAGKLTSNISTNTRTNCMRCCLRQTKEARALRKRIRGVEKRLAEAGYQEGALSERVLLNLDFAEPM
jgi:hypothetical protein